MVDLQNSFTAGKTSKFPTKPILGYPPHLKYVAALPWKNKNQKFCTFHARKTCFRCDFLSSIQQIKEMPNVVKISAKINTMLNINILRFVCSLSLTSLKLWTVGLSTIKHQHSKKLSRWIEANWTKNTWKMQLVCKSLFTKSV